LILCDEQINPQQIKAQEEAYEYFFGDLSFIPREGVFTLELKHPQYEDKIEVIICRDSKGRLSAFRSTCPYDNSKTLSGGKVFGDKLVCPHHGCEFDLESGHVEKYPSMNHLFKIPLIRVKTGKQVLNKFNEDNSVKELYRDDENNIVYYDIDKDFKPNKWSLFKKNKQIEIEDKFNKSKDSNQSRLNQPTTTP
jgi:nitrite reductase/ring-hydroxylating ferredoxin subunit